MSLHLLGAERQRVGSPWKHAAIGVGTGLLGMSLWRKHPVLGFLGGAALGDNVYGIATKEVTWKQAAVRLGQNCVATASSLALPAYPAVGYVAGSVAAGMLVDGRGNGLLEEWTNRFGVHGRDASVSAPPQLPRPALPPRMSAEDAQG